jgi:hypothetical protein
MAQIALHDTDIICTDELLVNAREVPGQREL